jgi:sortase A
MARNSPKRRGWPYGIERGLIIAGLILLGFYAVLRIHSTITFRAALRELQQNNRAGAANIQKTEGKLLPPDSSRAALGPPAPETEMNRPPANDGKYAGKALALLRIPALQMEVPVLEGTDVITLNSGVGRIAGTAFPGEPGNMGIAGHRDSFFEGLKRINKGDTIELIYRQHTDTYVVDLIEITSPEDVSVLAPGGQPEVTLVTCWPFSFIGPAPRRFVVRASLKQM